MVQDDSGQVSALKLLDRRGKSCPEVVWLTQEFKMAKMMLDDSMQHPNLLSPRKLFGNHECRCIVTNYAPLGMPSSRFPCITDIQQYAPSAPR